MLLYAVSIIKTAIAKNQTKIFKSQYLQFRKNYKVVLCVLMYLIKTFLRIFKCFNFRPT